VETQLYSHNPSTPIKTHQHLWQAGVEIRSNAPVCDTFLNPASFCTQDKTRERGVLPTVNVKEIPLECTLVGLVYGVPQQPTGCKEQIQRNCQILVPPLKQLQASTG